MKHYKASAELKSLAKGQLMDHYSLAIGAVLILGLIRMFMGFSFNFFIDYTTVLGTILYYGIDLILAVILGVFTVGELFLFLKISCGQKGALSDIFYGFNMHPDKIIKMQFFIVIISTLFLVPYDICNYFYNSTGNALFFLLSSIAGVIGGAAFVLFRLSLSQCFYLLLDFPDHSAKELMQQSIRVMKGNKGRLFYLYISFIPLMFLGFMTCGIAFLWLIPYIRSTMTNFFLDLMHNQDV
ncbi:MAG: DUF975 family protein [Lachnospiraceae bacterium]|nr:DUF975 family protein [Lachnospiraceae bacterium]